jgi:Arc/MetJ family transcription regulator
MSRSSLDLDDALVAAAKARLGLSSTQEVVQVALRRLLDSPVDAEFIRRVEGLGWDGDLGRMRAGDAPASW